MKEVLDLFSNREDLLALGWGLFGFVLSGLFAQYVYRRVKPLVVGNVLASTLLAMLPLYLGTLVGALVAYLASMDWLVLVGLLGGILHSGVHAGLLWLAGKVKREAEERI